MCHIYHTKHGQHPSPPPPPPRFAFAAYFFATLNKMTLFSMLLNGVSVERSDLGPTQGLVMHGSGDEAPALWRLYVRPPYVIQNGLACDIVVWASQPPPERDVGSGDASVSSPGSASGGTASRAATMKRRLTLGSLG